LADVADSFFAESGSRRTPELGRAGRNAGVIAAAPAAMERSAAPGERSEVQRGRGVIDNSPLATALDTGGWHCALRQFLEFLESDGKSIAVWTVFSAVGK
jgi:hypothetical protein